VAKGTFVVVNIKDLMRYPGHEDSQAAVERHQLLVGVMRESVEAHRGTLVAMHGEELSALFNSADEGVHAAMQIQERVQREADATAGLQSSMRIGVASGSYATTAEGVILGAALKVAEGLSAVAGPGETLTDEELARAAKDLSPWALTERGYAQLAGVEDPIKAFRVLSETPETGEA
jgi:class 3 adenylate cyclase